jgi:xanthine dehydrogenase YagS FAD-binding subunit
MKNFAYLRVDDASKALDAARGPGTQYIAGGTELLNWMRLGIVEPDSLVDIGPLHGNAEIRRDGDDLVIGALATLNEIGEHPLIVEHATTLAQACLKAASAQIRNRATIGGNVLQKTRCPYFRSEAPLPWGCNKRIPGSGCAARHGINERHAIFGWTDVCVATHPSDPLVALACLDARAEVAGSDRRRRTIDMRSFHFTQQEAGSERRNARDEAQLETRLAPGELITSYRMRVVDAERSAYVKVRERESYEYALVSAAAALSLKNGRITRARVALGSVAQRPWRLSSAEQALVGLQPVKDAVLPAIRASFADARPLEHNRYKIEMAANAAARAITLAGESA